MATWEEVQYRGGFYAYCKACEEPMSLRHAHNSDMAICYECVADIEDAEWFGYEDGFWFNLGEALK